MAVLGVAGLVLSEEHGFDVGTQGAAGMDVAAGRLVFDAEVLRCEEVAVEVGRAGHIAVGLGDATAEEGCDDGRLEE